MAVDFAQAVLDRTGITVDPAWADAKAAELLVQVRQLAPAQRAVWTSFDVLPVDVQIVVLAALARIAENPRGYRSESVGDYSYQLGGPKLGASGVFTVPEEAVIGREAGTSSGLYSVTLDGGVQMPQATPDVDWDYL